MTLARRLGLRLTKSPLALIILFADLAFVALVYDPKFVQVMEVFAAPAIGALCWIAVGAFRAEVRCKKLRRALAQVLAANDDGGIIQDDFPDLPVCVGKKRLYCARGDELEVQPLEDMVWAYVEEFRLHPTWHQLVIWNRKAEVNVLALRECFIVPALERLRTAAPWLPVGYSMAMKESWNADHRDFLAMVEEFRRAGRRFDLPFALPGAGTAFAQVTAYGRGSWAGGMMNTGGSMEATRLKKLWAQDLGAGE
jgi:hypothetical protein